MIKMNAKVFICQSNPDFGERVHVHNKVNDVREVGRADTLRHQRGGVLPFRYVFQDRVRAQAAPVVLETKNL